MFPKPVGPERGVRMSERRRVDELEEFAAELETVLAECGFLERAEVDADSRADRRQTSACNGRYVAAIDLLVTRRLFRADAAFVAVLLREPRRSEGACWRSPYGRFPEGPNRSVLIRSAL